MKKYVNGQYIDLTVDEKEVMAEREGAARPACPYAGRASDRKGLLPVRLSIRCRQRLRHVFERLCEVALRRITDLCGDCGRGGRYGMRLSCAQPCAQ